MINKKQAYSTTTFLETKEVKEDVIILKDNSLRSVIMVSSLNFDLKSDEERAAILAQFQDMVNAVDFPIEIVIHSRRLIIDDYLKDIKEKEEKQTNELLKMQTGEYAEFIKSFIDLHTVMSKTFYIVVPYVKGFDIKKPSGLGGFFKKNPKEEGPSLSELEEFARSKVQLFQRVNNIIGSLSSLGLNATHLQTDELKELLFKAYNPGEENRAIDFSKVTDLNDLIAPSGIMIESDYLKIAQRFSKTFYTFSYPRYLTDAWLENVINLDLIFDISLFIHPSDTATLVKSLRGRVAEVQSQISSNEEKGIVRDPVLETAYKDLEELRDKLQQGTEKFFRVGLYITIYAETLAELRKDESVLTSLFDARLISLKEATFMQEDGFNSTLPLGIDKLLVHTPMNTEPIASFFPFVSTDLSSGHGVLYGINRHNNSLIIFDRFSLQNGNMILFATSGAGKSYTAKLEVLREMMMGTDVIIIDPEAEYQYLAETVGGTFVKISLTSAHHINPFELPPALKDENNADILKEAVINLEGLIRLLIGKLNPEEDAILEKALIETYASKDITPESDLSKIEPPIFTDFYRILSEMWGGAIIAQRLEKYVSGVFAGFLNFPTNVDMENQLVIFNIRDLQVDLRPVAMYVILNYIWTRVRSKLKKRILLVDEAWIMMQNEDSAAFLFGIAKRCRKYYLGLTTITQDVADFMQSKYGRPIITNSSIQILLKQSPAIVNMVQETFNLTDQEKNLLLQAGIGEGIFFAGLKRAAIRIIASYTEDQIITSDPKQLLEIEAAKKELVEG